MPKDTEPALTREQAVNLINQVWASTIPPGDYRPSLKPSDLVRCLEALGVVEFKDSPPFVMPVAKPPPELSSRWPWFGKVWI